MARIREFSYTTLSPPLLRINLISGFHVCPQIYSANFDNMMRLSMKKYFLERKMRLGPCAPKIIEENSRCHTLSEVRKRYLGEKETFPPNKILAV